MHDYRRWNVDLEGWERWRSRKDTALTGRHVVDLSAESDVTSLTPGGVPRVLDDVVIRSVTNSKNSVVQSGATAGIRVDTRLVKLE